MRPLSCICLLLTLSVACNSADSEDSAAEIGTTSVGSLGDGQHGVTGGALTVIADSSDGLDKPRDLAFSLNESDQLWVVNNGNSSVTIIEGVGTSDLKATHVEEKDSGTHFLAKPAALAFSDNGNFATAHEEDEPTQGAYTPDDFMGPTLWPSDLDDFDGGHASHLDMMHNSPNAVGIAWESGNAFWIYDGYHESITLYDFNDDHGMGGSDHSDGELFRFVEGDMEFESGISSHMDYDDATGRLYIAETARGQISVLDATSGEKGSRLPNNENYDAADYFAWEGAALTTLTTGSADMPLQQPSGLARKDGLLYVSDYATSRIFAFDDAGALIDWVDTGIAANSIMGIDFGPDGALYIADARGDQVYRLAL